MQKLGAVFFGVVLAAIFALCVVSPFVGWWMPQNVSSFGGEVDNLFYIILAFTGVVFVLTEALLCWFMFRYAHSPQRKVALRRTATTAWKWSGPSPPSSSCSTSPSPRSTSGSGSSTQGLMPEPDQIVQVTGRQWEWRIRYPAGRHQDRRRGPHLGRGAGDRRRAHPNELHTWKGAKVRIYLKTQDVIHSFGLPNLRLMQDALPGKTIPMWFSANGGSNTQWNEADRPMRRAGRRVAALGDRLQGTVRRRPLPHARPALRPPRPGRFPGVAELPAQGPEQPRAGDAAPARRDAGGVEQ